MENDERDRETVEAALLRRKAKALLRKRARALRSTIPADAIARRSSEIARALAAHPAVEQAASVALFDPIRGRNEVDLGELHRALCARGAVVAYPAIDRETAVMTFRACGSTDELEDRGYGFREPSPDAPEVVPLGVVIVPALLVDARGHRLGYGAGYYDRTLPRYAPPARTIAAVFSFQVAPELPSTENDVAVDLVVTETGVREVER